MKNSFYTIAFMIGVSASLFIYPMKRTANEASIDSPQAEKKQKVYSYTERGKLIAAAREACAEVLESYYQQNYTAETISEKYNEIKKALIERAPLIEEKGVASYLLREIAHTPTYALHKKVLTLVQQECNRCPLLCFADTKDALSGPDAIVVPKEALCLPPIKNQLLLSEIDESKKLSMPAIDTPTLKLIADFMWRLRESLTKKDQRRQALFNNFNKEHSLSIEDALELMEIGGFMGFRPLQEFGGYLLVTKFFEEDPSLLRKSERTIVDAVTGFYNDLVDNIKDTLNPASFVKMKGYFLFYLFIRRIQEISNNVALYAEFKEEFDKCNFSISLRDILSYYPDLGDAATTAQYENIEVDGYKRKNAVQKENPKKVKRVDLTNLCLTDLSGIETLWSKEQCEAISCFSLNNNRLRSFDPKVLISFPNMELLDLTKNNISEVSISKNLQLPKIHALNLNSNKLKRITSDFLTWAPSLQKLELGCNELIAIDPQAFRYVPYLRSLGISDNENLAELDPHQFKNRLPQLNFLVATQTAIPREEIQEIKDWYTQGYATEAKREYCTEKFGDQIGKKLLKKLPKRYEPEEFLVLCDYEDLTDIEKIENVDSDEESGQNNQEVFYSEESSSEEIEIAMEEQ